MRKDLISFRPVRSSFFSCGTDIEAILKTLFVLNKPHSDILKRLLIINNKDCLRTDNPDYQKIIDSFSLDELIEKGYIRLNSKISRGTHEEIKSYILISLDNFTQNRASSEYRDYIINFDVVCYNDAWVLDDYNIRPLMICGYIEGILNSLTNFNQQNLEKSYKSRIKLSGIGEYRFLGCNYNILNQDLSMYTIAFYGIHFTEDIRKIGQIQEKNLS